MKSDEQHVTGVPPQQLPKELIDRITRPLNRFLHIETTAGVVLLAATVAAIFLANSPWAGFFSSLWHTPIGIHIGSLETGRSLHEWINEGLMTLFFFLVSLELKRELVLGELSKPRMAALSIAAAFGGMLVPAAIYLALQWGQPGQSGWGTVMATDTAFVIGCLALMGSRIPREMRVFMLSLAIVDDIGAILIVAIGYSHNIRWEALALAAVGFIIVRCMALLGIRNISLYFIVGGLIWLVMDASGIHATVTGIILGLMTPTGKWVSDERLHTILDSVIADPPDDWSGKKAHRETLRTAEAAAREALSPVERLEMLLHPWVGFVIMPLFAFANAGIPITISELHYSVAMAVFLGFVLGKPAGVFIFSWAAINAGMAIRPAELSWRLLAAGSLFAGIGFTMALFIANLAFGPDLINSAKFGILAASVFSAIAGILLLSGGSFRGLLHPFQKDNRMIGRETD